MRMRTAELVDAVLTVAIAVAGCAALAMLAAILVRLL